MYVALAISHLNFGGAQRVVINLANELARKNHKVDIIAVNASGGLLPQIDDSVRIVDLNASGSHFALPSLVRYLRRSNPDALISSLTQVNILSLLSKKIAFSETQLILVEHSKPREREMTDQWELSPKLAKYVYPMADSVVAVSEDIAKGVSEMFNVPIEDIHILYNPVIDGREEDRGSAPPQAFDFSTYAHTLLGVGRLEARKDFGTLLRAHHELRSDLDIHTIILGDGPQRDDLIGKSEKLGINDEVTFTGYVDDPYAYMSRASVFALSSVSEGFPSVLIEAMACGCPVVSTDCSSAIQTILKGGEYGPIVPTGEPDKLAEAIARVVYSPPELDALIKQAEMYSAENITQDYIELLNSIVV